MIKRICVAFGTRPEASKLAPVIRSLQEHALLTPRVLITGQHREQLDEMLSIFNIKPDADLNVMVEHQDLSDLTARMVQAAKGYLRTERPDFVLVHGDTASTLAVALAAFFEGIPVGHIEAGLRSFDLTQPFPEEGNRRLVTAISSLDLPPTTWARDNLIREGKNADELVVTGNTAVDAVRFVSGTARLPAHVPSAKPLIAITMHRRENLPVMSELAQRLAALALAFPERSFIYPVHLNPAVQKAVRPALAEIPNVLLDRPWDYPAMVALLAASELIITDSGGIQEEGAALGVPVAVLRNVTERPEGVEAGVLELIGNDPDVAYERLFDLLKDEHRRADMRNRPNPYGDGTASKRIVDAVAWKLGLAEKPADWVPAPSHSREGTV